LVVLDAGLRVLAANRSFYKFFKVKQKETIGNLIYDLGNRQWDIPACAPCWKPSCPKRRTGGIMGKKLAVRPGATELHRNPRLGYCASR
jgi:PAS domain-containing protein